jgi:hypothetical protein
VYKQRDRVVDVFLVTKTYRTVEVPWEMSRMASVETLRLLAKLEQWSD